MPPDHILIKFMFKNSHHAKKKNIFTNPKEKNSTSNWALTKKHHTEQQYNLYSSIQQTYAIFLSKRDQHKKQTDAEYLSYVLTWKPNQKKISTSSRETPPPPKKIV